VVRVLRVRIIRSACKDDIHFLRNLVRVRSLTWILGPALFRQFPDELGDAVSGMTFRLLWTDSAYNYRIINADRCYGVKRCFAGIDLINFINVECTIL
jgi:hypothetical protein